MGGGVESRNTHSLALGNEGEGGRFRHGPDGLWSGERRFRPVVGLHSAATRTGLHGRPSEGRNGRRRALDYPVGGRPPAKLKTLSLEPMM